MVFDLSEFQQVERARFRFVDELRVDGMAHLFVPLRGGDDDFKSVSKAWAIALNEREFPEDPRSVADDLREFSANTAIGECVDLVLFF